ncbi:MAG: tyrosine-type recombinase/integrase [Pyrinomonadaceae bacterium]
MNEEVRKILLPLCRGKAPSDCLFANPITRRPYTDINHAFNTACRNAGITGLWWHDLRATFGTRLGEAGHGISTIMDLMGHRVRRPVCVMFVLLIRRSERLRLHLFGWTQNGHTAPNRRVSCFF